MGSDKELSSAYVGSINEIQEPEKIEEYFSRVIFLLNAQVRGERGCS